MVYLLQLAQAAGPLDSWYRNAQQEEEALPAGAASLALNALLLRGRPWTRWLSRDRGPASVFCTDTFAHSSGQMRVDAIETGRPKDCLEGDLLQ